MPYMYIYIYIIYMTVSRNPHYQRTPKTILGPACVTHTPNVLEKRYQNVFTDLMGKMWHPESLRRPMILAELSDISQIDYRKNHCSNTGPIKNTFPNQCRFC